VSYYFKSGHRDLGCEFLHKSFREYLFAEGVVETLKRYGQQRIGQRPLAEREPYWKEFEMTDPRHEFRHELARLLAPQWLSWEVVAHLEQLLAWEIARSSSENGSEAVSAAETRTGRPTEPLPLDGWEAVRDALADLWDWWAEGVHLRPQPSLTQRRDVQFAPPYAQELVEWSLPLHQERGVLPEPEAYTTMDAHLGDALCRLAATVHFRVAEQKGWLATPGDGESSLRAHRLWHGVNSEVGTRRCQSVVQRGEQWWVLFRPAGTSPEIFVSYIARVNSASGRPSGSFPINVDLIGADLSDANLIGANLFRANLSRANLIGANLFRADLSRANLIGADLNEANLNEADLIEANLSEANLSSADLIEANLSDANLSDANLFRANLIGARGLTRAQIAAARTVDSVVGLPDELRPMPEGPPPAEPA